MKWNLLALTCLSTAFAFQVKASEIPVPKQKTLQFQCSESVEGSNSKYKQLHVYEMYQEDPTNYMTHYAAILTEASAESNLKTLYFIQDKMEFYRDVTTRTWSNKDWAHIDNTKEELMMSLENPNMAKVVYKVKENGVDTEKTDIFECQFP